MKRPRWSKDQWETANLLLIVRSGNRCEVCWKPLRDSDEVARHHRQRRGVGGDRLSNLLLIHGDCHRSIHSSPELARDRGWIVSSYEPDPAAVPIPTPRGLVLLDDDGESRRLPTERTSTQTP